MTTFLFACRFCSHSLTLHFTFKWESLSLWIPNLQYHVAHLMLKFSPLFVCWLELNMWREEWNLSGKDTPLQVICPLLLFLPQIPCHQHLPLIFIFITHSTTSSTHYFKPHPPKLPQQTPKTSWYYSTCMLPMLFMLLGYAQWLNQTSVRHGQQAHRKIEWSL